MAILRSEFHKILDAKKKSDLSREQLALKEVLDGKTVLRCHAHKTDDIAAILRLKREFGIRISIEHALNVTDKDTFAELAELGVPVVYGPIEGIGPKCELKNMKWRNIGLLIEAGGPFGLMSDHDINPQCELLLTTRFLLRFGYSKADAIRKITLDNAAIIGLDDILGSLEKGKLASFACWDGDPFDLASKPVAVYAEGRIVHRE
jgi:imidazolonepropionase-like amidohydrolase